MPTSPNDNDLWWDSNAGVPYIRYNDGNTTQWVSFANPYGDNIYFFNSAATLVLNNSANWDSTYNTVNTNSARWNMELATWFPRDNQAPSASFAVLDNRGGFPVLDFSDTTVVAAIFPVIIPVNANFQRGLQVSIRWTCTTDINAARTVGWLVDMQNISVNSLDVMSTQWTNLNVIAAASVPTTLGATKITSTVYGFSALSSLVAGDYFRLRIRRDVNNDDAIGDAELVSVRATIL